MIEKTGVVFSLFWRVLWCLFPFVTEYSAAAVNTKKVEAHGLSNDAIRYFIENYSYSVVIVACVFFLIIGSVVGYFYPAPKYGVKPYPKWLKILISMGGGMLAFIHYIHSQKDITPAVIIWVAGVSFVAPAIIHLIHAAAIKFTGMKLLVSDEDLKRINKSFGREK